MQRWSNGDVYTGDWKRGVPHGRGEMTKSFNGEQYVGQFKDGRRSGFGTIYYTNNSTFVGRFSVSKKEKREAGTVFRCFIYNISHNFKV